MGFHFKNRVTGEQIGYGNNLGSFGTYQSAVNHAHIQIRKRIRNEIEIGTINIDTDSEVNAYKDCDIVDDKGSIYSFDFEKLVDNCVFHTVRSTELVNEIFIKDCLFKKKFKYDRVYVGGKSPKARSSIKEYRDKFRKEKKVLGLDRKVLFQAEYSWDLENWHDLRYVISLRFESDSERTLWTLGQSLVEDTKVQKIEDFEASLRLIGLTYHKFDDIFNRLG